MRLFVALNLPENERNRVYRTSRPLREGSFPVSWVDPNNFHVTMKFFGQVHPDRVAGVSDALDRVATETPSFDVEVDGFGAFPTIRRPQVLWVAVDPSPALRCLKQDIEWALAEIGFQRETKAFHPHLTLGRADREGGAGLFRGLDALMADMSCGGAFKVRTLDLMRSQLSREGPRYSILSSSHLSIGR